MQMTAIRELTIRGRSEGLDRVTADLAAIDAAQKRVASSGETMATATDQSARRQTSAARSYESLRARVDEAFRAQQQFARAQAVVDRALQQGVITANEHAQVIERARKHYLGAGDDAARGLGLASHEMVNLGRQVSDVGTMLAMGQSPFMVLVSQGPQVLDIFQQTRGSMAGFASQLRAMITPTTAVVAGLVALGAGAYAAMAYWKGFALALDDSARAAGVTSSEMAKLQAAASFKGIGSDDFAGAMKGFAGAVYQAENNMGSLGELLAANGQKARGFADAFDRVANLIQNAASDQQRLQILQQASLPATMQWVRYLVEGSEGLRKAKESATEFGGAANDNMIRKAREFDEAWNRTWTNFSLGARSATVTAVSGLASLVSGAESLLARLRPGLAMESAREEIRGRRGSTLTDGAASDFYGAFGSTFPKPASKTTVDPQAEQRALQLEQQRISVLGELASVTDQVRAKELELAAARKEPGSRITDADVQRILEHTRAQALGLTQMQQQAGQYRIEAETVGMSTGAATAYRAEQEKLLEFRLRGITLTEAQSEAVRKEAKALGEAADAAARRRINEDIRFGRQTALMSPEDVQIAQQLRSIYPDVTQALNSSEAAAIRFNNTMKSIGDAGREAFGSLAQAMSDGRVTADELNSVLTSLQSRLIQLAANKLWDSLLSGATGGAGSILASLFPNASGNVLAGGNVVPFARGGVVDRPTIFPMATGAGLMGEAGPEAVMPLRRTPDGRLGVAAAGGGSPRVNVNVINNNGSAVDVGQASVGPDGSISMDVVVDRVLARGADQTARGRGGFAKQMSRSRSLLNG